MDAFKAALGPDFDVDEVALKEALAADKSWNIFVVATALRFDLFPVGLGAFDEEEMRRRRRTEIAPGIQVFVKSAEDTVLRKLLWFKAGAEANAQQLRDVVEVIRRQGSRLDASYLDGWAAKLGITTLLARARSGAT